MKDVYILSLITKNAKSRGVAPLVWGIGGKRRFNGAESPRGTRIYIICMPHRPGALAPLAIGLAPQKLHAMQNICHL